MKRFWPRILSAFSTLALGVVAGSVARFVPVPATQVQPPCSSTEVKVHPAPPPPDADSSELYEQAYKAIYLHGSLSGEVFLKYNYRELTRLAARGNAKQREWLRNCLETCDEGAEKQSLLTVLGGEQP